jgi:small subunit ribosomal protein S1
VDQNNVAVKMDVDTEHEFKIVKMNQEEKKVGLSIRAVGEEASRAEVESYKERGGGEKEHKGHKEQKTSSSSSSSSTTLGDLINWKRSEREGE